MQDNPSRRTVLHDTWLKAFTQTQRYACSYQSPVTGGQDARPRREVWRGFYDDRLRTLSGGNREKRSEGLKEEYALEAIVVGVMA
jgi:hypothetical protein